MRPCILGWCGFLTALIALAGASCPAESIGDTSMIGGLSDMIALEPLAAAGDESTSVAREAAGRSQSSLRSGGRQSVPARDRAATYRSEEVFRNSKAAMPLLVVDLEPQVIFVPQPMSGRSVGATPAAAWTRTSLVPVAAERRAAPVAWPMSGR